MKNAAIQHRMGVAVGDGGGKSIRLALIDMDQRPAMDIGEEFVAIQSAGAGELKGVAGLAGLFL